MLAYPSMIAEAAKQSGMAVPPNPDEYKPEDFPHFHVYCNIQLGVPITWGNHWENAKIVAAIPMDRLKTITYDEIVDLGFNP